jgi:hypothetical protein
MDYFQFMFMLTREDLSGLIWKPARLHRNLGLMTSMVLMPNIGYRISIWMNINLITHGACMVTITGKLLSITIMRYEILIIHLEKYRLMPFT